MKAQAYAAAAAVKVAARWYDINTQKSAQRKERHVLRLVGAEPAGKGGEVSRVKKKKGIKKYENSRRQAFIYAKKKSK